MKGSRNFLDLACAAEPRRRNRVATDRRTGPENPVIMTRHAPVDPVSSVVSDRSPQFVGGGGGRGRSTRHLVSATPSFPDGQAGAAHSCVYLSYARGGIAKASVERKNRRGYGR